MGRRGRAIRVAEGGGLKEGMGGSEMGWALGRWRREGVGMSEMNVLYI